MNKDNSRGSITIFCVDLAAGVEDPRLFLTKGENVDHATFKQIGKDHGAPAGSKVIATPNA